MSRAGRFPTTQLTLLGRIAAGGDDGREAFATLIKRYGPSVELYLVRRGCGDEAADVAQAFWTKFVSDPTRLIPREPGASFRARLIASLDNHLHDWNRHARRARRGGDVRHVLFDESTIADAHDAFADAFALDTLRAARQFLAAKWTAKGRSNRFEVLVPLLGAGFDSSEERRLAHTAAAERIGVSPRSVDTLLSRLSDDLHEAVRHVAGDYADEASVDEETREVFRRARRGR